MRALLKPALASSHHSRSRTVTHLRYGRRRRSFGIGSSAAAVLIRLQVQSSVVRWSVTRPSAEDTGGVWWCCALSAVNGETEVVNCSFLKVDDLMKRITDKQAEMETAELLKSENMTHKDLWMDLTKIKKQE